MTTESDLPNAGGLCRVWERNQTMQTKPNWNLRSIDLPIMEPVKYLMLDNSIKFELSMNECGEYDVKIGNDFITLKPEELFHTLRIVMDHRETLREARIGAALYDFSHTMLEFEANREQVLDANLEARIASKMY